MGITLLLFTLLGAGIPGSNEYFSAGEALRQGKYADALKGFSVCAAEVGPLRPYARAQMAACRAGAGDARGALEDYEAVLREFPEGPWVKMIQAELAEIYSRTGDSANAAKWYEAVLERRFRSWWLQRLEWTASERFAANPATASRGYAFFRQALEDPAYRGRRYDAAEMLSKSSDVNDLWLAADALVRFGAIKTAAPVVEALAPQAMLSPDARARWLYLEGRVLLGQKNGDEGRALLLRVVQEYKGSVWAAKSLYQLFRNAKAEEVDAVLGRLLAEYPGSEEAGDALWWRAEQFREKEEHTSATVEYLRLATLFPSHEKAADALLIAGDLLRERQKPAEALDTFQRLVTQYPNARGRSEAAYWSGRLEEKSV
ncbi:MAG: tetratricopeptide repeat protein, partial [FCB group bacterium]|nr:tetratricopeptide repeat protein [FCB group bacterium]